MQLVPNTATRSSQQQQEQPHNTSTLHNTDYSAPTHLPSTPSAPSQLTMAHSQSTAPTPSQLFETLQTKAVQYTQQSGHSTTQTVGPAVQAWQMVEQVPTNDQDKEEYERNKYEFKSWKGTVCYPAPQELWNRTERDLEELYPRFNVPQMPDFEHKYLAALFAAMEKPFRTSGESTIFCIRSASHLVTEIETRQSSNYVSSLEIQLSILPWDRNRQLLEYIKRKSYSSQPC